MQWNIFSLYPELFSSFLQTSLISRAVDKKIISANLINWRDFGKGAYKQVDDKVFGGGSGMVLQPQPIFEALQANNVVSEYFFTPDYQRQHVKILPNNIRFYKNWLKKTNILSELTNFQQNQQNQQNQQFDQANLQSPQNNPQNKLQNKLQNNPHNLSQNNSQNIPNNSVFKPKNQPTKVTISLTPRGFPFTQHVAEWLTTFDSVSLLCGRFEGFDARVDEAVDLEISLGNFVLNGGEVGAMAIIEAVSRLLPGFVDKMESVQHDSFSSSLNIYSEQSVYFSKSLSKNLSKNSNNHQNPDKSKSQSKIQPEEKLGQKLEEKLSLFSQQNADLDLIKLEQKLVDDIFCLQDWLKFVLPNIEHPQYTRPDVWQNWQVPSVLLSGNHRLIQEWRKNWFTPEDLQIEKGIKG